MRTSRQEGLHYSRGGTSPNGKLGGGASSRLPGLGCGLGSPKGTSVRPRDPPAWPVAWSCHNRLQGLSDGPRWPCSRREAGDSRSGEQGPASRQPWGLQGQGAGDSLPGASLPAVSCPSPDFPWAGAGWEGCVLTRGWAWRQVPLLPAPLTSSFPAGSESTPGLTPSPACPGMSPVRPGMSPARPGMSPAQAAQSSVKGQQRGGAHG